MFIPFTHPDLRLSDVLFRLSLARDGDVKAGIAHRGLKACAHILLTPNLPDAEKAYIGALIAMFMALIGPPEPPDPGNIAGVLYSSCICD